jgi:sugar phosphate isomerase/epimerase
MEIKSSRRRFLGTLATAGATVSTLGLPLAALQAVEPLVRRGKSRLRLSMAAYSFRQYFTHTDPAKKIALFDFMDYCADRDCDGTELTSYYFPKNLTADFLLEIRRYAILRGLAISGTSVGNNFALPRGPERDRQIASVKEWIDHAALMGAPHIRVFAGSADKMDQATATKMCIEALEECADYAAKKGIFLGLENHGGIVTEPQDLLSIIKTLRNPWLGINLDTGNFHTDDPYRDLADCAPYAVNVQFKSEITRRGQKKELADLPRLVKILRDANYQGYVALEYEAAEDPYQAVPGLLKTMRELFGRV